MGKYYTNSPGDKNNVGPFGCTQVSGTGAHAYDQIGDGCWGVTGVRVVIADTTNSIHQGFERTNWNFSVDGSQPAVPNNFGLPGICVGCGDG